MKKEKKGGKWERRSLYKSGVWDTGLATKHALSLERQSAKFVSALLDGRYLRMLGWN
jgi:hypothetical protein